MDQTSIFYHLTSSNTRFDYQMVFRGVLIPPSRHRNALFIKVIRFKWNLVLIAILDGIKGANLKKMRIIRNDNVLTKLSSDCITLLQCTRSWEEAANIRNRKCRITHHWLLSLQINSIKQHYSQNIRHVALRQHEKWSIYEFLATFRSKVREELFSRFPLEGRLLPGLFAPIITTTIMFTPRFWNCWRVARSYSLLYSVMPFRSNPDWSQKATHLAKVLLSFVRHNGYSVVNFLLIFLNQNRWNNTRILWWY